MQDLHTSEESRYMPHLRQTVLNTSRREGAACSGSPLIRLRRTSPRAKVVAPATKGGNRRNGTGRVSLKEFLPLPLVSP